MTSWVLLLSEIILGFKTDFRMVPVGNLWIYPVGWGRKEFQKGYCARTCVHDCRSSTAKQSIGGKSYSSQIPLAQNSRAVWQV